MARLGRSYPISRLVTPRPRGAPLFDAVGAGAAAGATTWTFNITIGSAAKACVVGFGFDGATSTPTATAKVGSTSMTQLDSILSFWSASGSDIGSMFVFGLLNPPTGTQTVTVTTSASSHTSVNAISYDNVSSFGTTSKTTGTGSTASHSVLSAPGRRIVQMFSIGFSLDLSAYNQTSRYSVAHTANSQSLIIGDAPSVGLTTFSASISSSTTWGSIAVPLIP